MTLPHDWGHCLDDAHEWVLKNIVMFFFLLFSFILKPTCFKCCISFVSLPACFPASVFPCMLTHLFTHLPPNVSELFFFSTFINLLDLSGLLCLDCVDVYLDLPKHCIAFCFSPIRKFLQSWQTIIALQFGRIFQMLGKGQQPKNVVFLHHGPAWKTRM